MTLSAAEIAGMTDLPNSAPFFKMVCASAFIRLFVNVNAKKREPSLPNVRIRAMVSTLSSQAYVMAPDSARYSAALMLVCVKRRW